MTDYSKIDQAADYLWDLTRMYKLEIILTTVPCLPDVDWLAQYEARQEMGGANYRYGYIRLNVDKNLPRPLEDIFHTVRHEIAHAICHQKGRSGGHGPEWIRIAKLLRVNTKPYEPGGCFYEPAQHQAALRALRP